MSTSTKIPFHLPVEVGRWDGDGHGGPHLTEKKNLIDVDEKKNILVDVDEKKNLVDVGDKKKSGRRRLKKKKNLVDVD